MDAPKLRRLLILLHLYFAAFLVPVFALVAITGGLHMVGGGEHVEKSAINLPAGTLIDFKSDSAMADVHTVLKAANADIKFEYLKDRGNTVQTRPTSRTYVEFKKTPTGWTATRNDPNLLKSLMEIHKGHGPKILRTYHKLAALGLVLVLLGGLWVGILSKAYRRKTVSALSVGAIIYVLLVLFG